MAIDQDQFRYVLGHFGSGVTVVTMARDQRIYGLTVSSFASISLNPPLVMVCIDQRYPSHDILLHADHFAVNILAEEGEQLSRHFASKYEDKFQGVAYHYGVTDAPLLDDALAVLECRKYDALPGGDHTIFLGEVLAMTARDAKPLLYYRSGYGRLA
ncbi:MAG: flavin reductase family protein [Herpetosiphon sp.]